MSSTAESAAARIASILIAAGLAGGRVFRDRTSAFAQDESPAILIEIGDDDAQNYGGGGSVQTSAPSTIFGASLDFVVVNVGITYLTRSANWQTELDALRLQAHRLLLADADLNALLQGFRRTTANWDAANADTPFGTIVQRYTGKTVTESTQL